MKYELKGVYRIEQLGDNNWGIYLKNILIASGISSEKLALECLTPVLVQVTLEAVKQTGKASLEAILKNIKLTKQ